MPWTIVSFQKSWKLSSFKESLRRSRATAGSTWSFFDDWAAFFNSSVNLPNIKVYMSLYVLAVMSDHSSVEHQMIFISMFSQWSSVIILGGVVRVDDRWWAQQLLELLGFECLWEALQRHQQQLQLLWSPEGWSQVSLQSTEQHLLKHLLRYLKGRIYTAEENYRWMKLKNHESGKKESNILSKQLSIFIQSCDWAAIHTSPRMSIMVFVGRSLRCCLCSLRFWRSCTHSNNACGSWRNQALNHFSYQLYSRAINKSVDWSNVYPQKPNKLWWKRLL